MLLVLALVASEPCVTAPSCPTREELLDAVNKRDDEHDAALMVAMEAEDPGIFVAAEQHSTRLSHVVCGAGTKDGEVNCSFTAKNRRYITHEVATLDQGYGLWRIIDYKRVRQKQRGFNPGPLGMASD